MHCCQHRLTVAGMLLLFLLNACSYVKPIPNEPVPVRPPTQPTVAETPDPINKTPPAESRAQVSPQATIASEPTISTPPADTQTTAKPATQQTPQTAAPLKQPTVSGTAAVNPAEATLIKPGSVQGTVRISDKKNKSYKPSNVIVTLLALNSGERKTNATKTHAIDMRNKTYSPVAQTILKGDKLQFHNHDDIKHNVFSSSGDNTFDLGTFEGGGVRTVALQHPGIVKVYCNIHPEMATFVMVTDNPFNAITNRKGEFTINTIPPGKYTISLWHIRGELQTDIEIQAGTQLQQQFIIDASNYQRTTHKNKFGKDYEKKPALFEDEFY